MVGTGTIANVLAIVAGGSLAAGQGRHEAALSGRYHQSLGLATLFIGASGALAGMLTLQDGKLSSAGTRDTLFMILALALGTW